MIPLGARVGVGALGAALLAAGAGVPPVGIVAAAGAATAGAGVAAARAGGLARARGPLGFVAGAWLLAARLAAGGGGAPAAAVSLPTGAGPWEARVAAMSAPREGTQRLTVALEASRGVLLAVTAPRFPAVEPGDRVRLAGRVQETPEGGYGEFLRRTGVTGTLRSPTIALVGHAGDPRAILERVRRAAGDALARALPEPAAGLAAGILVGLRDRVDRDLAAAFTATGLSHVVAISGWNIALVGALVGAVLGGRSRRTRSGGILAAIVAYTLLAGASASVVRASAMAGVALLARASGRPAAAAAALGWAVALLVLVDPANATDVGLQLSAAATAGLVAWATPLTGLLDRHAPRLPGWVRDGLGVSLAAQAATLPIVLLAFGRVAPWSLLTNLAVVPLVPLAMATGAAALGGGAIAAAGGPGPIAVIAGIPGALVLGLLIGIVRGAAALPLANLTLTPPAAAALAALVAGGLVVALVRRRAVAAGGLGAGRGPRPAAAGARGAPTARGSALAGGGRPRRLLRAAGIAGALAFAVLVVAAATRPDGRTHIIVLDVGQGDAILLAGPSGGRILVDGGPDPDRLLVALDARVPPWDRRIDLVVLTHPHEDHVGGLPLIVERYRVGRVVEPGMPGRSPGYGALHAAAAARRTPVGRLEAGEQIVLDGVTLDVLWPDGATVPAEPTDDGSTVNDSSIILLGSFAGRRFLLAGDAEADVEARLVARGLPTVDLLKAGHHGSRTSTTEGLVAAIRPRVAAISVGAGNDYGHPSPEVLERLAAAGAAVLRTDQVGSIDVAFDAAGVRVRTDRPPPRPGARTRRAVGARGRPAALPYDRGDASPVARGRRRPPPLARAPRLAPPPCSGGGRDRGLARGALRGPGRARRPLARRGGRPPPRCRQGAPPRGRRRGALPWGGLRGVARGARVRRARSGRSRPLRHPPRRARRRPLARRGVPRGADRGVRRQAGRATSRVDGIPLRRLASAPPRRLERRGPGRGPRPGRRPRGVRLHRGGDRPVRGAAPALDGGGAPRRHARAPMSAPALGYFWGDDEYGIETASAALGRRVAGDGEPLAAWRTTGAATRPGEIAERVATATLFGGGTLVLVEDPLPLVRAAADRDALLAALHAVAPGNALAFLEAVDGSSARRPKALEDLATAVAAAGGEVRQVVAPREGGMARWIADRAAELGVRIEPAAAEALARKVGAFVREGDVDRRRMGRLAVAELEKLAVYRLDAPIRAEDVDALVADAVPGSVWALADAVGSRKAREASVLLERLFDATPEQVLVAVLHRRIRELILVGDHRERGDTLPATARALKLKEFPARKLWEQGLAWREDELVGALEGLLELDAGLKGERGRTDARRRRLAFALWLAERVARA